MKWFPVKVIVRNDDHFYTAFKATTEEEAKEKGEDCFHYAYTVEVLDRRNQLYIFQKRTNTHNHEMIAAVTFGEAISRLKEVVNDINEYQFKELDVLN